MHPRWRVPGLIGLLVAAVLLWRWQAELGESAAAGIAVSEPGPPAEDSADAGAAPAQAGDSAEQTAVRPNPASAPRKEPAVALDAPALGYRASAAQRADDMARLVAAEDLAPLLAEFKRRAANGDADAAARMRDIYDECMGVHLAQGNQMPAPAFANAFSDVSQRPVNEPARQAALQIGSARCGAIIPSGGYKERTIQLGRMHRDSDRLAADLGNPAARVRMQGYELNRARRAQLERLEALLLLREGSAESLMELSNRAADTTPFQSESWMLAACELGYPCANIPGIRYNYCATHGSFCDIESLQEFTRQSASARQWRLYQAERDQILALLQAGDLGALLLSDEAIGGGG
ncbi:MAG: hypothetical protein AB7E72_09945 [Lysobacterales bacterium]